MILSDHVTRNGFIRCTRSEFERDAPADLQRRAADEALQHGGFSWVIFDPIDGADGCLFIGDDPERITRDFMSAFELTT